jgi:hypothetical protein
MFWGIRESGFAQRGKRKAIFVPFVHKRRGEKEAIIWGLRFFLRADGRNADGRNAEGERYDERVAYVRA